jgi:hypothetical protein
MSNIYKEPKIRRCNFKSSPSQQKRKGAPPCIEQASNTGPIRMGHPGKKVFTKK